MKHTEFTVGFCHHNRPCNTETCFKLNLKHGDAHREREIPRQQLLSDQQQLTTSKTTDVSRGLRSSFTSQNTSKSRVTVNTGDTQQTPSSKGCLSQLSNNERKILTKLVQQLY